MVLVVQWLSGLQLRSGSKREDFAAEIFLFFPPDFSFSFFLKSEIGSGANRQGPPAGAPGWRRSREWLFNMGPGYGEGWSWAAAGLGTRSVGVAGSWPGGF